MKKILFWVLACLFTFAFAACERTVNPYDEDPYKDPYEDSYTDESKDKDDIDPIEEKEEVNYCEVIIETYGATLKEVTYEGGYGYYTGAYLVPHGTSIKISWVYSGESYQATFEVGTAKALRVCINGKETNVVNLYK